MKILLVGGQGTIGRKVAAAFSGQHELIIAGRASGDVRVDICSEASIAALFKQVGKIDACICAAGTGFYGPFATMTAEQMRPGLVLIGKEYVREGGSFTLTSGIAAELPARNGTTVAMINGAVNSFVLGASQELRQDRRINAVSPGLVEDSGERYGANFPGYDLVPMSKVVNAYRLCVEGAINGKIIKVY